MKKIIACFNTKKNFRALIFRDPHSRFNHVDGFRALSILWVMALHAFYIPGYFLPKAQYLPLITSPKFVPILQGHLGVDVFFVISGFLIGNILLTEIKKTGDISLSRFYLRRAFRLLPAYFFAMLLFGLVIGKNLQNSWANILYVNNYLPLKDQFMGWTWSLAIEEQFYILCPLLLLFAIKQFRQPLWLLGVLFFSSFLIIANIVDKYGLIVPAPLHPVVDPEKFFLFFDHLYDKTHTRFGGLLAGVIAAMLWQQRRFIGELDKKPLLATIGAVSSGLVLFFFAFFSPFEGTQNVPEVFNRIYFVFDRNLVAASVAFLLLWGFSRKGKNTFVTKTLSHPGWYPIAQVSYSAYLFHVIVMFIAYGVLAPKGLITSDKMPIYFIVLPALSLLVAGLVFIFIERPFNQLREIIKTTKS